MDAKSINLKIKDVEKFHNLYTPEPNSGCWLWDGHIGDRGYGKLNISSKQYRAHRLSWVIHFNKIPDNKFVLHKCDTPACVNPSHLFLGDTMDNIKDKVSKNRHTKGETAFLAKLKEAEVLEILASKDISHMKLAHKFKCSQSQISRILKGQSWRHLTR